MLASVENAAWKECRLGEANYRECGEDAIRARRSREGGSPPIHGRERAPLGRAASRQLRWKRFSAGATRSARSISRVISIQTLVSATPGLSLLARLLTGARQSREGGSPPIHRRERVPLGRAASRQLRRKRFSAGETRSARSNRVGYRVPTRVHATCLEGTSPRPDETLCLSAFRKRDSQPELQQCAGRHLSLPKEFGWPHLLRRRKL